MKRLFATTLILLSLVACTPTEATRGNYLFQEDVDAIRPNSSTQYDVVNLLGTPTSKAVFDDNTWYYVGLKTQRKSFFDEKVVDRQTIKITFDDTNTVTAVEKVEGEALNVPLENRVTPTSGNEVTILQQLLGNVGKFNPQQSDPGNPAR
tara:strand:- start:337 stop:786 length:450 start_codon:yes stop_codon:yes gene_type:complete